MAKVQIKSEKLTPFGGIFSIMYRLATVFWVSIRTSSPQSLSDAPIFYRRCKFTNNSMA